MRCLADVWNDRKWFDDAVVSFTSVAQSFARIPIRCVFLLGNQTLRRKQKVLQRAVCTYMFLSRCWKHLVDAIEPKWATGLILFCILTPFAKAGDSKCKPVWLYRPVNESTRTRVAYEFHVPLAKTITTNIKTDRNASSPVKLALFTCVSHTFFIEVAYFWL